jgi:hypothetical protein
MIIEAIFGLAMNVFLADSATGQNVTRSVLMYKKLERIESSKEEQKQFTKDLILGVNNDN